MDPKQLNRVMVRRFLALGHTATGNPRINKQGIASLKCSACGEAGYTTATGKLDGTALRFTCRKRTKQAKPASTVQRTLAPRQPKQPTHTDLSIKIYREDVCEYCGKGSTIIGRGCRYCSNDLAHSYSEAFVASPPPIIRYRDSVEVTETILVDHVSDVLPIPDLSPITHYETVHNIPKYITRTIRKYTGIEQLYRFVVTKQAPEGKPYKAPCGCTTLTRAIYYHEDYDSSETDLMPDTLYRYDCIHRSIEHRSFIVDPALLPLD